LGTYSWRKNNLNIKAAALDVAGDLLGSVAAFIAICVVRCKAKQSAHILLEGAPDGFDRREVSKVLEDEGVLKVHHIHAWSITQERPVATLEAQITGGADANAVRDSIGPFYTIVLARSIQR